MIEGDKNNQITVLTGVNLAGVLFLFPNETIRIYHKGNIYRLHEAYQRRLVRKADLKRLLERYIALYPELDPDKKDIAGWLIQYY